MKSFGRWATGVVVVAVVGCASESSRVAAEPKEPPVEKWNGGKMRAPLDVQSSLTGEVGSADPLPVTITVTPEAACRKVTTALRGLDGVEVSAPAREHVPCIAGQPLIHVAQVRVPPGVSGRIVADVSIELESGQQMATSRSFELRSAGAATRQKSNGTVTYDANGNPIILMPSGAK